MKNRISLGLAVVFCLFGAAAAMAQMPARYPIKADDGDTIANFDLKPGFAARLDKLPGKVAVGNLNGDVTLMQFYDLNCPYCREAAADIDTLVRSDNKLKLVFVPVCRPVGGLRARRDGRDRRRQAADARAISRFP